MLLCVVVAVVVYCGVCKCVVCGCVIMRCCRRLWCVLLVRSVGFVDMLSGVLVFDMVLVSSWLLLVCCHMYIAGGDSVGVYYCGVDIVMCVF